MENSELISSLIVASVMGSVIVLLVIYLRDVIREERELDERIALNKENRRKKASSE